VQTFACSNGIPFQERARQISSAAFQLFQQIGQHITHAAAQGGPGGGAVHFPIQWIQPSAYAAPCERPNHARHQFWVLLQQI
jgi:hypothetical protein